jgi:NAD(P)-dependent dehydrogenase (short-subunit alcohol dehydrogenase family)
MNSSWFPKPGVSKQPRTVQAGQPSELAETIAFLASDRGNWITAHNYYVDGGAGAK